MLQILLAFLAISIVSVTGYGLMEQLSLQQIMLDQRENARRLDVAAEAIQSSIVGMGASGTGAFAPQPVLVAGFSQMPASIGGINRSVGNVPFRYCPVVVGANGAAFLQGSATPGASIALRNGSYSFQVNGSGLVTGASLSIPADVAAFHPVAFIISAGRGDSAPPFCDEVVIANGRPRVPGGLVRIVSQPSSTDVAGASGRAIANLYVANGASGTGRSPNDPTSIQNAFRYWSESRPSSLTIHVSGAVSASTGDWNALGNALAGNGGSLAIVGDAANSGISGAPSQPLVVPAELSLRNILLPGVALRLESQSSLSLNGSIELAPNAILSSGGRRVSGTAAIALSGSGYCWASEGNDATFIRSTASNSSPVPPSAATGEEEPVIVSDPSDPSYAASVQAHNAWREKMNQYQNARMTNLSNFTCMSS